MSKTYEKEIFDMLRNIVLETDSIPEATKKVQALIEVACDVAHNEGYYEGYDRGRNEGYENGKREGYDEGYRNGLDDACERVSSNLTLEYDERNRLIRRIRG